MAAVSALAYADIVLVALRERTDDTPGLIAAAVVYEQDAAILGYQVLIREFLYLIQKHRRRYRQHLLLVIAGDDNIQNGMLHVILLT